MVMIQRCEIQAKFNMVCHVLCMRKKYITSRAIGLQSGSTGA